MAFVLSFFHEPSSKTDGLQKFCISPIRAQRIQSWIELQPHQPVRPIGERPGQPGERLIVVAAPRMNESDSIRRHISLLRHTVQAVDRLELYVPATRLNFDMADRRPHDRPT